MASGRGSLIGRARPEPANAPRARAWPHDTPALRAATSTRPASRWSCSSSRHRRSPSALGLAAGVVELRSRFLGTADAALEERAVVAAGSARLVCGRAARALSGAALEDLVERLRASAVAP